MTKWVVVVFDPQFTPRPFHDGEYDVLPPAEKDYPRIVDLPNLVVFQREGAEYYEIWVPT